MSSPEGWISTRAHGWYRCGSCNRSPSSSAGAARCRSSAAPQTFRHCIYKLILIGLVENVPFEVILIYQNVFVAELEVDSNEILFHLCRNVHSREIEENTGMFFKKCFVQYLCAELNSCFPLNSWDKKWVLLKASRSRTILFSASMSLRKCVTKVSILMLEMLSWSHRNDSEMYLSSMVRLICVSTGVRRPRWNYRGKTDRA